MSKDYLKFRVWDKTHNRYIDLGHNETYAEVSFNGDLTVFHWIKGMRYLDDAELLPERCTGICDIDGKPVYEGDIIRRVTEWMESGNKVSIEYSEPYTVEWRAPDAEFSAHNKQGWYKPALMHCKVVGNVHDKDEQ